MSSIGDRIEQFTQGIKGLITSHEEIRREAIDASPDRIRSFHEANRQYIRPEDMQDYDDAIAKGMGIILADERSRIEFCTLTDVVIFWVKGCDPLRRADQ